MAVVGIDTSKINLTPAIFDPETEKAVISFPENAWSEDGWDYRQKYVEMAEHFNRKACSECLL